MSRKIKLNLRSKTRKNRIYRPLDNGGYPFIVEVSKKDATISRSNGKKLCRIPYDKIFTSNGTSLLLKKKTEYIFIGSSIKSFKPFDTIKSLHSPLDNADTVYPYAVGDKYTYLLIQDKYIPNEVLTKEDPYVQYYDFSKKYNIKKYALDLKMKTLYKPDYSES